MSMLIQWESLHFLAPLMRWLLFNFRTFTLDLATTWSNWTTWSKDEIVKLDIHSRHCPERGDPKASSFKNRPWRKTSSYATAASSTSLTNLKNQLRQVRVQTLHCLAGKLVPSPPAAELSRPFRKRFPSSRCRTGTRTGINFVFWCTSSAGERSDKWPFSSVPFRCGNWTSQEHFKAN